MANETVVQEGFQSVGSAMENERSRRVLIDEAGMKLAETGK
jgi:hypothetical protein